MQSSRDAVWLCLQSRPISAPLVFEELLRLFSQKSQFVAKIMPDRSFTDADLKEAARHALATHSSAGVILILDDGGLTLDDPLLHVLNTVTNELKPFIDQIVITAKSLDKLSIPTADQVTIIDRHNLRIDSSEAQMLADSMGVSLCSDDVGRLLEASRGHAALYAVLLRAVGAKLSLEPGEPSLTALGMLEHLLQGLPSQLLAALEIASLLGEFSLRDAEMFFGNELHEQLNQIARELPLVQLDRSGHQGETIVRVHDLVSGCVLHRVRLKTLEVECPSIDKALLLLGSGKQWSKAWAICELFDKGEIAARFINRFGEEMLKDHHADELLKLVSLVALQDIMKDSKILLYWAQGLYEIGKIDEAMAKLNAAITLAGHDQKYETLCMAAACKTLWLVDQGKAAEAVVCAEQHLAKVQEDISASIHCELLLAYAGALAADRKREASNHVLNHAERVATFENDHLNVSIQRLKRFRVLLDSLWTGDWSNLVRRLGPMLNDCSEPFMARQMLCGNLALGLVETGRLARGESLLNLVCKQGNVLLDAAYLPAVALVQAAKGNYERATAAFSEARSAAVECGDEADIHVNLLYQAVVERAFGATEQALASAERSFEELSHCDFFSYSTLAQTEIAAGLLALEDHRAARKWIKSADIYRESLSTVNCYHALSGAMVLAVADYRDDDIEGALTKLAPLADYIKSDSANWRMAMYCRVHPELLGMLAMAVGSEQLPVHMLRMVLPENVERGLRIAVDLMPREEWLALGQRALGEDQFEAYLQRKGRPICRVHLFGGLEVLAGEKQVTDRDWKKRKARLLFAMLVLMRGQDIPRDQILDHLWPDLPEQNARNNFYVVWSTMKSALLPPGERAARCPYVENPRGRCRIVRDALRSDIDEFEELMAKARQAEAENKIDEAVAALQDLMGVYRGELLPGDIYDDWFAPIRDKYRFDFIEAMMRAAELLFGKGDPCEALIFVRRAIQVDRCREDLYQMALKCHIAAGQRGAAIETFIHCKTELSEELGLDPSAETMNIYQEVLAMEERPRYESSTFPGNSFLSSRIGKVSVRSSR